MHDLIGVKCLGCNVLMGAHSTHDKVLIRILDNFWGDGRGQLASFTDSYTVFSDRTKL